jgi:DNA polymerase-4
VSRINGSLPDSLTDLNGIKRANAVRLHGQQIYSVWDFYQSPISALRSAFASICGYYWYLRLRGWEIDDIDFGRKSFGHMYSLPKPLSTPSELSPILHKLVEKLGFRLRAAGYQTAGVHIGLLYKNGSFWHQGRLTSEPLFESADIYKRAFKILSSSPYSLSVGNLSVSCFNLTRRSVFQPDLFGRLERGLRLTQAVDAVNSRWGNFVITPAAMMDTSSLVPDRIGFGSIKDMEQFIFS